MNDDRGISLQRLFPTFNAERLHLFLRAAESGLEAIDFYTIKDLQDLSGYSDDDLATLLLCQFLALREGSVCIELSPEALARRLEGLASADDAARHAAAMLAALQKNPYPDLIGTRDDATRPLVRPGKAKRDLLYFQKHLRHERALKTLLDQRLAAPQHSADLKTLQPLFKASLAAHAAVGVNFSSEQKLAIALSLLRNFVVISGGPGTGKTSVVFALLNCLIRNGTPAERIQLACPTGRAAQRLTESLRAGAAKLGGETAGPLSKLSAQTVHRLLGYNPRSGTFGQHRENQLSADVLIVDEVSMMDVVLMSRFLEASAPHAKIVFLGDKDQLPSVDAGSVLADLMPRDGKPAFSESVREKLTQLTGVELVGSQSKEAMRLADTVVILKKNFRSQQQITEIARSINDVGTDPAQATAVVQRIPALKLEASKAAGFPYTWPAQAGGCFRLDHAHHPDEWRAVLDAWARFHYVENAGYPELVRRLAVSDDGAFTPELEAEIAKVFAVVSGARVLTLIRDGIWGCEGVNLHLARLLSDANDRRGSAGIFPGAPVLVTSNDYTLDLFNGDVGVTLKTADGALRVVFERQDESGRRKFISLPHDILPQHELAFAMTVHKSQGSEYGQVLLALPPEGAQRLQNRQLVYTAITRAKQAAACFGAPTVLSAAIARALERCSGLTQD